MWEKPPGFVDFNHPNHVHKLEKTLYRLKQEPRSWYERLSNFLVGQSFVRDQVDKTLFIKRSNNELLLVQIYVDDIIFGASNESLCKEFSSSIVRTFGKRTNCHCRFHIYKKFHLHWDLSLLNSFG